MSDHLKRGERMERTLSIVLAVLAVVSVVFLAVLSLSVYMGITYRATLSSTYEYRVSIAPDAAIDNVTLFLPIPSKGRENSAILEMIGGGRLGGVPPGWSTSLIGTEKVTMLELTAREIPPAPAGKPYLLSVVATVPGPIRTSTAGSDEPVLERSAQTSPVECVGVDTEASPEVQCEGYREPVYADFTARGPAHLSVYIYLDGKNTWDVFGPSSNEYQDGLQVSFSDTAQRWQEGNGVLITGIGDYGIDFWVQGEGGAAQGTGASRRVTARPARGEGGA